MSLDCPDFEFPIKQSRRDMARPTVGSWKTLKKITRYLAGARRILWKFRWQDESRFSRVFSDSDWGGNPKDRKSTSGD
eukprot:1515503-Karenia_brevis.AAC.1